jgi:hypothetical protein
MRGAAPLRDALLAADTAKIGVFLPTPTLFFFQVSKNLINHLVDIGQALRETLDPHIKLALRHQPLPAHTMRRERMHRVAEIFPQRPGRQRQISRRPTKV